MQISSHERNDVTVTKKTIKRRKHIQEDDHFRHFGVREHVLDDYYIRDVTVAAKEYRCTTK